MGGEPRYAYNAKKKKRKKGKEKRLSLGPSFVIACVANGLVHLLASLLSFPLFVGSLRVNGGFISVIDRNEWGDGTFIPLEIRVRSGVGSLGNELETEFGISLHNGHPTLVEAGQII